MTPDELRDGIFALRTRRLGTVAELLIKRMKSLGTAKTQFHDLFDDLSRQRVEVKFSCVLESHPSSITEANVLTEIDRARKQRSGVPVADASKTSFDCNIQQIKPSEFDVLYYGLFFHDAIVIHRSTSADVPKTPGFSDKQHKGNKGEGQFHVKDDNFDWHRKQRLYKQLTYAELLHHLTPPNKA